jgi:Arm DNA-binding domain/Phage integrase, N-terminal SAM-like domain
MRIKITKRAVDSLSTNGQDVLLWDADVRGFGLRCRSSSTKHYVLKMRLGGRQRWFTIGRHGSPWTPDGARKEALRLLGLRAAGEDPATERDRQKSAITIGELAERFLQEHVAHHCKPRTAEEYRRAVSLYIRPGLGHHRIADLTRSDIAQFHHQHRNHPYQANRSLSTVSLIRAILQRSERPSTQAKFNRRRSLNTRGMRKVIKIVRIERFRGRQPTRYISHWPVLLFVECVD